MKISKEKLNWFLDNYYKDAKCELNYDSLFHLLLAVTLSAQTTDAAVNKITPILFDKYKTPKELGDANIEDVENIIHSIGLYKNKAKNIIETAKILHSKYNDEMPKTMEELTSLPGVGRKTASVMFVEGFKIPALPVDTHIHRISQRLGIIKKDEDVLKAEKNLRKLIPEEKLIKAHHQLIFFGRYQCMAKNPLCEGCVLKESCNYKSK